MSAEAYFEMIHKLNEQIRSTQMNAICKTAKRIADSIKQGGVLHIFGSGHSHMIGEDVFYRAGGLACINAMLEPSLMELNIGRATLLERMHGYGQVLLSGYKLEADEVLIVISNSGINPVPIEIALEGKRKGLHVVAITSETHSKQTPSRHEEGLKLTDIADIVIDNCGQLGDAMLKEERFGTFYGPTSTQAGILIMQMIIAEVVTICAESGFRPPLFVSANREKGHERNQQLVEAYQSRVRYFPK
ncbi:sugar isomerase domain-containing protein [Alkalihalobacillus sp. 1P02AB]|uniref:sugar isomerase domain-containing protein n=1 Tax=Alkalihalobacillus sp. 1P02AB TaxID=3132260 RepID=UPI0039A5BCB2